jgi:two-component system, NarL family, invasion response regulator UvrY
MAVQRSLNVLVVDDHAIIRRGLRDVLRKELAVGSVNESASCRELDQEILRTAPDLVLLDLQLADCNALERIDMIKASWPGTRILVYSMGAERVFAEQAIAHGASGFLSKATDERELLLAVRKVMEGGTYLSQEMELYLSTTPAKHRGTDDAPVDPFAELSEREEVVMNGLLSGGSVKEIAARLDLQPTTVATYKARLFDKLGVHNLLDLQRLVIKHRSVDQQGS